MIKRILTLVVTVALVATACKQAEDNRYFAPEVEFASAVVQATSESGAADVVLNFSRPAQTAFSIGLNYTGTLQENLQFKAPHSIDVAAGASGAVVHIELVDNEIWDESAELEVVLVPGLRYTVNPDKRCKTQVSISKSIVLPILSLQSPSGEIETNPFLAETLSLELLASKAPIKDVTVGLEFAGFQPGQDYLVNGKPVSEVILPNGATKQPFEVQILKKDISGLDRQVKLSITPNRQAYVVSSGEGSVEVHLYDPLIDLSPIWKTAAQNGGTGYQIRQAIKAPDGSWEGNSTMDMWVSSEGSNYIRSYRNMFKHPSFSCMATAGVSLTLRLSHMFPDLLYPNPTAILDYGNDQNHRSFFPVDSLMRLVADKGSTVKGQLVLTSPKTFVAFVGSYNAWQDKTTGNNAWVEDSKATNGDIFASTHNAITGKIYVTLEKLEGRFDMTDKDQPLVFTAWFSSDAPEFMRNVDFTKWAVEKDGGLWKVEYKLWPR